MTNINLHKSLFRLPNGKYITPYTDNKGALEVGDIGQSLFIDESKGLRRRLNGQTVGINSNTQEFVNKLHLLKQNYPTLFCTEDEWQDIKNSNYMQQCGKFVLQEDNIQTREQYNIGVVGTLTRKHGIVTGFVSNANSLILQEALPWATATSIEAVFKVNITSITNWTPILGNTGDAPTGQGIVLQTAGTNTPRLYLWVTTNGTTWTISQVDTGIDLAIGDNYFKIDYNGSTFTLSKSVDGENWVTGTPITTGVITSSRQWIGASGSTDPLHYLKGSMDLTESYIKVNGEMWCKPFEYVTEPVEPYVRLPRVTVSVGNLNYENLNKVGLSNRLLVYTRKPAPDNNFTWCNVYADGWVEQGGSWNSTNGEGTGYRTYTVYFPRPFNSTNYTAIAMPNYTGANLYSAHANDRQKERITFYYVHETANWNGASWFACGWSEVPKAEEYNVDTTDVQFPYFIQISQGQATLTSIRNDWEINNPYTLFDAKQSQYPLNNASWLRTYGQWNEKSVYTYAYEALLVELNNSIETNTTVDLPSGGKYTKHLQTVNFNANKVDKIGSPIIEEGILTPYPSDYVQFKVNDALSLSKRWQLNIKMKNQAGYVVAPDYTTDYIPFAVSNTQLIVNNTVLCEYNVSNILEWFNIRVTYDDVDGYNVYFSANNIDFEFLGYNNTVDKIEGMDNFLNLKEVPVDLRTVQFTYSLNGTDEYIITTGTEYKAVVWNKAEHTTSELDYAYNFIVDTAEETFRLPLYDRVFNNPYADLYYYVGDVAQNTGLIDVGRLSDAVANNKGEIEKLRNIISQLSGDVPTVETSTYKYKAATLINLTPPPAGDTAIDLSPYIPLDGHEYDVSFVVYYYVGDTSGTNRTLNFYNADKSQLLSRIYTDGISHPNQGHTSENVIVPLPANSRNIVFTITGASSGTTALSVGFLQLQLKWFRKY